MKTFEKFFRYRVSYEKIDKYVNLVLKTLDPNDEVYVHYDEDDNSQFVRIEFLDRVLHWWKNFYGLFGNKKSY